MAEKPSFRQALKTRRCLIPADGFYEWAILAETKNKLPLYFLNKSKAVFAFAGLWETWTSPNGEGINSVTIITIEPNALVRKFHLRMPVILPPNEYMNWLTLAAKKPDEYQTMLMPYPEDKMDCYPVSPIVNSAQNESPEMVVPFMKK